MSDEQRKAVVFDLDGCLSDDNWRLHHLNRSYEAYNSRAYEDSPMNYEVAHRAAEAYDDIYVFTARPGAYRVMTERWLRNHMPANFLRKLVAVVMRGEGDERHSPELKVAWLNELKDRGIVAAFDDRWDVVQAYRAAGIAAELLGHTKTGSPNSPQEPGPPPEPQQEPFEVSPDFVLERMAALYRERNAVYGSNFEEAGAILDLLHGPDAKAPAREILAEAGMGELWHLWTLVMVKMTRFANSGLTHDDSIRDIGVYAAMISSIINNEGKSNE